MRWLTKTTIQAMDDFITEHVTKLDCYKNNNPEHKNLGFTINHNWSGIGINTFITCNCCGERKDISDYDMW